MSITPLFLALLVMASSCQNAASERTASMDTVIAPIIKIKEISPKPYDSLQYESVKILAAAPGTKSVLFNNKGSKLYAMNLEGMSVYEFDQAEKKVNREFRFHPTKGIGWDYVKNKPISSFQEKPVEACLAFDDKLLWVSLHNAEGIVPIWVDSIQKNKVPSTDGSIKPVTVIYPGSTRKDSFFVPLIKTGKTPKVLARTSDNQHLLVSNWHSRNVSVLKMDEQTSPFGTVIETIPVAEIPRGIVVDDKTRHSYVAIMGGSSIAVLNNETWKTDTILNVSGNPRHLVMDDDQRLYVSYNSLGRIACLDAGTGKELFGAPTHSQPRTIVLSRNKKFIFVTCYSGDFMDVYKINPSSFSKIASLPCKGHPVGVDIFEDDTKLEAWVCSYSTGSISVYSFKKF